MTSSEWWESLDIGEKIFFIVFFVLMPFIGSLESF